MPSARMFMSPRSDLTIRNLTAEQIEAICNAAVDIVGGVVSFSESPIYESQLFSMLKTRRCGYGGNHPPHNWALKDSLTKELISFECPGFTDGVCD